MSAVQFTPLHFSLIFSIVETPVVTVWQIFQVLDFPLETLGNPVKKFLKACDSVGELIYWLGNHLKFNHEDCDPLRLNQESENSWK